MEHFDGENMTLKMAEKFAEDVRHALSEIVEKKLNILEVPESNGMVLVREGSKEEEERNSPKIRISVYDLKEEGRFILCHK